MPSSIGRYAIIVLALAFTAAAFASADVRVVPVTVTRGAESSVDTFGTAPGATYGLDPLLGERELQPRPFLPAFDARFLDHRQSWELGQGQSLHLQAEQTDTFRLAFQGGSGAYRYVVRWPGGLAATWSALRLVDAAGTGTIDVDMLTADSCVVTQTFIKALDIIGTPRVEVTTFTIDASSDPGGTIDPAGSVVVNAGGTATFTAQAFQGYTVSGFLVDGNAVTGVSQYTFTNVGAAHSIHATIVPDGSTPVSFRTFTALELTEKFPVPKRPSHYRFSFRFVNETPDAANAVILRFGGTSKNVITLDGNAPFTVQGLLRARTFELSGAMVAPGDTVTISGTISGEPARVLGWQWEYPQFMPYNSRVIANFLPEGQVALFPMPNAANVREALFRGSFDLDPLLVGTPRGDSSSSYGWVRINEPYRLRSSLLYHRRMHAGAPRPYSFVRERRVLTPSVHDNVLFANQAVLKFNIRASMLGVTPPGLGELVFVDTATHPLNGKSVHEIAAIVDSLLTGCPVRSLPSCGCANLYASVNAVVERINASFSGAMDTMSFVNQLVLKGVAAPTTASGLHAVAGSPRMATWHATSVVMPIPTRLALAQNFPNPFNPTTTIRFDLPRDARVSLTVYDQLGREVARLLEQEEMPAGSQEAQFDGSSLGSGVYYYRLSASWSGEAGSSAHMVTGKMLLVK